MESEDSQNLPFFSHLYFTDPTNEWKYWFSSTSSEVIWTSPNRYSIKILPQEDQENKQQDSILIDISPDRSFSLQDGSLMWFDPNNSRYVLFKTENSEKFDLLWTQIQEALEIYNDPLPDYDQPTEITLEQETHQQNTSTPTNLPQEEQEQVDIGESTPNSSISETTPTLQPIVPFQPLAPFQPPPLETTSSHEIITKPPPSPSLGRPQKPLPISGSPPTISPPPHLPILQPTKSSGISGISSKSSKGWKRSQSPQRGDSQKNLKEDVKETPNSSTVENSGNKVELVEALTYAMGQGGIPGASIVQMGRGMAGTVVGMPVGMGMGRGRGGRGGRIAQTIGMRGKPQQSANKELDELKAKYSETQSLYEQLENDFSSLQRENDDLENTIKALSSSSSQESLADENELRDEERILKEENEKQMIEIESLLNAIKLSEKNTKQIESQMSELFDQYSKQFDIISSNLKKLKTEYSLNTSPTLQSISSISVSSSSLPNPSTIPSKKDKLKKTTSSKKH